MQIIAIVTADQTKVGGGTPIFFAKDEKETSQLALVISRVCGAAVHDLQNGVLIIVKH